MKNQIRKKAIARKTKETDIKIELNLDGSGKHNINTGMGFFDHMLQLFSVHSGFDLTVSCVGDLQVDCHHSVEDIGIVLGQLLKELVGDKKGIARYGHSYVPMDESLSRCVIDFSGRAHLTFKADLVGKIGEFDAELIQEFFSALVINAGLTLHVQSFYGSNQHHIAESIFKSFARSLATSVSIVSDKVLSSKGVL